ncbi:YopX family protein [Enterococcus casseliflavus]|uniref:YopX family protein n=1 Tax=Enterococcus casseliflavus TaxID=37734 RepID=UPI003D6AAD0E
MAPKFRCWDERLGLTEVVSIDFFRKKIKINHWEYGDSNFFPLDEVILMQSTGLKDKNGVDIFEGDVLTSNVQPCKMVNPIKDGYGVVRFENGMFKLGAISLVTFISKMEVIGNVWENPNLLEQANEN